LGARLPARAGGRRDRCRSRNKRHDGSRDRGFHAKAPDRAKSRSMMIYVCRRLLLAIPTLFIMLTAIFVLVRLVPGDAASVILGDQAGGAALATLRAKLRLEP